MPHSGDDRLTVKQQGQELPIERRGTLAWLLILGATVIWSVGGYSGTALAQWYQCKDLTPQMRGMTDGDLLGKFQNVPTWVEHPAAGGSIWVFSLNNAARHIAVQFGPDDRVSRAVEVSTISKQPGAEPGICTDLTPQMRGMTEGDLLGKYKNLPTWIERPALEQSVWVFSLDNGATHVAVRLGPDGRVMRAVEIK